MVIDGSKVYYYWSGNLQIIKRKDTKIIHGVRVISIQKTKIMASGPITSWQIDGESVETVTLFWGTPKSLQMVLAAMKLKDTYSLEEKL